MAAGAGRGSRLPAPAFDGSTSYLVDGRALAAYDLTSGRARWRFAPVAPIVSAPIVMGKHVCVVSADGHLDVVDAGRLAATYPLGATPAPGSPHTDKPTVGRNAGDGILAVTLQGEPVVYR